MRRRPRSVDTMSDTQVIAPAERPIRVALSAIVLGILAVVLSIIPGACYIAFTPALLGGVMGVLAIRRGVADQWQGYAGLVLAPIAIALSLLTIFGIIRL
jgi:hypothetical protein